MDDSLQFLYDVYLVSIAIHIVSIVLGLWDDVPLLIKESRVQNGLRLLRQLTLVSGMVNLVADLASVVVLSLRFFIDGDLARYMIVSLLLIHALCFLGQRVIKSIMIRQQFTEKQKEFHEKIAKLEEAEK